MKRARERQRKNRRRGGSNWYRSPTVGNPNQHLCISKYTLIGLALLWGGSFAYMIHVCLSYSQKP